MNPIDFWRLHDDLSIDQATHLVMGLLPDEVRHKEDAEMFLAPSGRMTFITQYEAISSAIKQALMLKQVEGDLIPQVIRFDSGDMGAERVEPHIASRIKVASLKAWLSARGVHPEFFFPSAGPQADYLDPSHPRFAPKLAASVRVWLALSEHEEGKTPKQRIEKWVRENAAALGLTNDDGQLSASAVAEISKVANWAPQGGAPKTPV